MFKARIAIFTSRQRVFNILLIFFCLFFTPCRYRGRMPVEEELLTKEDTVRLKRRLYALQRDDLPPVTTHNVVNDWSDPVLNTIRRCKLFNTTSDKVKVRRLGCVYALTPMATYR